MDKIPLEKLIKDYQNKDKKQSFERIYRYFFPKIFRFIRIQVYDGHISEDLAAEVFIKVYKNIDKANLSKETIGPWIYRIARNTLIDHYRKEVKKSEEISMDRYFETRGGDKFMNSIYDRSDPQRVADGLDFNNEKLLDSLNSLPALQRQVILLRYVEEMDYRSIGMIMNRSENSVRAIKFRALLKLKEVFK